jgi:hypothetical protein
MTVCKRILAGLVFLVSAVGLLLSLAGGFGVWVVRGTVTDRTVRVFDRVGAAFDVADKGLDHAQSSLATAAERLEGVNEERRKPAQEPRRSSTTERLLARTVQQRIAPELGDANETLHTVAEAAVVINSVLEDLGSFPLLSVPGLDLDRLTRMNSRLAGAGQAAWELSRLLGDSEPESDPDAAAVQLSQVERTLVTLRESVDEFQTRVRQARQRTDELRAKTLLCITRAAVLASLVCFWVALSQVSLMFHACAWWRRSGRVLRPLAFLDTIGP